MTTALYAIYELTSDLNDLPDTVLCLCADCAARPSACTAIKLDNSDSNSAPCNGCQPLL